MKGEVTGGSNTRCCGSKFEKIAPAFDMELAELKLSYSVGAIDEYGASQELLRYNKLTIYQNSLRILWME